MTQNQREEFRRAIQYALAKGLAAPAPPAPADPWQVRQRERQRQSMAKLRERQQRAMTKSGDWSAYINKLRAQKNGHTSPPSHSPHEAHPLDKV